MKKLYQYYIIIAILYVLVKIVFVSFGYLHLGAILHGLVPATITGLTGFIVIHYSKNEKSKLWTKIASILPILIFLTTPIYMYINSGANLWLTNGRLPVLIIYLLLASCQFIIAFVSTKKAGQNN